MTYTIVGCGNTAKDWIPRGTSIGVNDAWKWGKETDALLVCNRPDTFTQERLKVITTSKPKTFYAHKNNWAYAFPEWQKVNLKPWYGSLYFNHVYYSNTSPFIAISLAFTLGAKEIILWGVDFVNHSMYHEANPETKREVERYLELITCLEQYDVNVYLGSLGTAFDDKLQVYNPTFIRYE